MVIALLIYGIIISLIFLGFIGMFVFFFSADIVFWWKARKVRNTEKTSIEPTTNIDTFKKSLLNASVQMCSSSRRIAFPTLKADTFIKRAKYFWKINKNYVSDNEEEFNLLWSEEGWLLYTMAEMDEYFEYVKDVFDKRFIDTPFKEVCQSQGGMIAILLYERTKENKYKQYVDKMCEWLLAQDTELGILFIPKYQYALVDVLGMAVPFLMKYGSQFSNKEAIALAEKTMSKYIEYGCDKETGIPSFSYHVEPPRIKCGASNWGRGCSWFIIGLLYIDVEHFDAKNRIVIKSLESTLTSLWRSDVFFGQFIGEWPRDLSAELPIVYYLYKKNLISLDEEQIIAYSMMCHNGVMYNSSTENKGIIRYGSPYGPNILSQAYMLRLIKLYEERTAKL